MANSEVSMMKHRLLLIVLTCCFIYPSASCVSTGSTSWQAGVDAVTALHQNLEFPKHLAAKDAAKLGTEFDVNQYFKALTHLHMQPGYLLDYVYHYDGMGGFPILYARPAEQAAYASETDLLTAMKLAAITEAKEQYLTYLQVEDTAEGYFDYVTLRVMANQFYQFWHAAYNDKQIVCSSAALEAVLKQKRVGLAIPITASLQARLLKLEPVITLQAETAIVTIITFSNWKGFVQETWTIERRSPYRVTIDSKVLVPYNCGVMF
jgi:hypothetical protein